MLPHGLQAVAASLSLAAVPTLTVTAAFPSLFVGEAGRGREHRQGMLRSASLAGLASISLLVYPSAILRLAPSGRELVQSGPADAVALDARPAADVIEYAPGKALTARSPSTDERWRNS